MIPETQSPSSLFTNVHSFFGRYARQLMVLHGFDIQAELMQKDKNII